MLLVLTYFSCYFCRLYFPHMSALLQYILCRSFRTLTVLCCNSVLIVCPYTVYCSCSPLRHFVMTSLLPMFVYSNAVAWLIQPIEKYDHYSPITIVALYWARPFLFRSAVRFYDPPLHRAQKVWTRRTVEYESLAGRLIVVLRASQNYYRIVTTFFTSLLMCFTVIITLIKSLCCLCPMWVDVSLNVTVDIHIVMS